MRPMRSIILPILATLALARAGVAQLQPGGAASAAQASGAPSTQTPPAVPSVTSGNPNAPSAGQPGPAQVDRRTRRDNPVISIQEMVRLDTQAASQLRGIGIVTGLKGTGDAGSELVLARPLAEVYANNGNPLGDLKDLAKAKAAAMVSIWCEIPESGGR